MSYSIKAFDILLCSLLFRGYQILKLLYTEILAYMGITIEPHRLLEASDVEKILTERIKIKGPRSKRKIAYENPSEGSGKLGNFPGGMELDLVKKTDDENG